MRMKEGWQRWPRGIEEFAGQGKGTEVRTPDSGGKDRWKTNPRDGGGRPKSDRGRARGPHRTADKLPGFRNGKILYNRRRAQAQRTLAVWLTINLVHLGLALAHYRVAPHQRQFC